ncbi:hypothetical protein Tco_1259655 [Tanacetum coccineum]
MSSTIQNVAHPKSMEPTATPGQETTLPHTFTAKKLHDPATGTWNMDIVSCLQGLLVAGDRMGFWCSAINFLTFRQNLAFSGVLIVEAITRETSIALLPRHFDLRFQFHVLPLPS